MSTLAPSIHAFSGMPDGIRQTSHREIVKAMATYARPNTIKGLALFLSDFALFWTAIAGVLFFTSPALKFLASIFAGVKMANLATLAHDAAHNSLTSSRRLNWLIGVLSFMPCLFNYRLWVYDHHALHHPHTNGDHVDSYQPLSKPAYDALSPARKAWYRFSRSGNPLAFGTYYIISRWWQVKFMPRAFLPQAHRPSAWGHFLFLCAYFALFIGALVAAPLYAPISSAGAVMLAFVVPFFVFQSLLAVSLYVNHTHPDIPWFDKPVGQAKPHPEFMTVHLRLPAWLAALTHNFYEHPAHHVYPAIPCYELRAAQEHMNRLLGAQAVIVDFSLSRLAGIFRQCKLYDYENHRWLDFQGNPTTPAPASSLILRHQHTVTTSRSK